MQQNNNPLFSTVNISIPIFPLFCFLSITISFLLIRYFNQRGFQINSQLFFQSLKKQFIVILLFIQLPLLFSHLYIIIKYNNLHDVAITSCLLINGLLIGIVNFLQEKNLGFSILSLGTFITSLFINEQHIQTILLCICFIVIVLKIQKLTITGGTSSSLLQQTNRYVSAPSAFPVEEEEFYERNNKFNSNTRRREFQTKGLSKRSIVINNDDDDWVLPEQNVNFVNNYEKQPTHNDGSFDNNYEVRNDDMMWNNKREESSLYHQPETQVVNAGFQSFTNNNRNFNENVAAFDKRKVRFDDDTNNFDNRTTNVEDEPLSAWKKLNLSGFGNSSSTGNANEKTEEVKKEQDILDRKVVKLQRKPLFSSTTTSTTNSNFVEPSLFHSNTVSSGNSAFSRVNNVTNNTRMNEDQESIVEETSIRKNNLLKQQSGGNKSIFGNNNNRGFSAFKQRTNNLGTKINPVSSSSVIQQLQRKPTLIQEEVKEDDSSDLLPNSSTFDVFDHNGGRLDVQF